MKTLFRQIVYDRRRMFPSVSFGLVFSVPGFSSYQKYITFRWSNIKSSLSAIFDQNPFLKHAICKKLSSLIHFHHAINFANVLWSIFVIA